MQISDAELGAALRRLNEDAIRLCGKYRKMGWCSQYPQDAAKVRCKGSLFFHSRGICGFWTIRMTIKKARRQARKEARDAKKQ